MKKNLLFLPLVLAGLAVSGCSKYDDSALSGRVTNVEGRVSKLEEQVNTLNRDIVAIRTLITAEQSNDYVTKVEPITEGGRSGYRIRFAKSSPITIFHGTNGRAGGNGTHGRDGMSPIIGVRQEGSIYYWTLNGDWLKDEQGRKVKARGTDGRNGQDGTAGRDGVTPLLKIENDYWHVSYDNGKSWQGLNVKARGEQGAAGANAFQAVRVEETHVFFTLADGAQTLKLPLYQEMSLRFTNTTDYTVSPNQTYSIPYTTTGVTSETQIQAVGYDGVRARILRRDTSSGVIEITTPSNVVDTEIIVLLADGRGYTKMYSLMLYQGVLTTSSDSYLADKSGATLEVPVRASSQYTVEIPSEASSWITYETLRAQTIRDERLRFTVQANPLSTPRSAVVKLRSNGLVIKSITIAQKGARNTYTVINAGNLEAQLGNNLPYELKLGPGVLSDADFAFLRKNSDRIKLLDLSELNMTELPVSAFSNSQFEEVKLPNRLTRISDSCFYASTIRRLNIPQSVTSIGRAAFMGCSELTGSLVIPQGVREIENSAFRNCSSFTGSLVIPQGVREIGDYAFKNCSGFTGSLVISQGVTSIGEQAFSGCSGFSGSLVIPQSLTSIGGVAFSGCSGFNGSLVISQGVTSIGWLAFEGCSGFTGSLVIPQSVTSIEWNAFEGCSGFNGDLIIEGAPEIGGGAFLSSSQERLNFRAVYSKSALPSPLEPNAFWGGATYGPKPQVLYIPKGRRAAYVTKNWSDQFERIEETNTWPQVNR